MLPEVEKLLRVQERDLKIRRLRLDLKNAPVHEAQAREKLSQNQRAVKAAQDAQQQNEVEIKKIELDIETRKTTIGRLKTQQFETRKNEEFRALEHDIARYEENISSLEDGELTLMEKAEALRAHLTKAKDALAETQKLVDAELEQIQLRQKHAQENIASLEGERRQLTEGLDEDLLQRYDRLLVNKAPAVAALENGVCGGCHMKVTPSNLSAVKAEKAVASCEQCGRILYWIM
jgi:uncharacterized protein